MEGLRSELGNRTTTGSSYRSPVPASGTISNVNDIRAKQIINDKVLWVELQQHIAQSKAVTTNGTQHAVHDFLAQRIFQPSPVPTLQKQKQQQQQQQQQQQSISEKSGQMPSRGILQSINKVFRVDETRDMSLNTRFTQSMDHSFLKLNLKSECVVGERNYDSKNDGEFTVIHNELLSQESKLSDDVFDRRMCLARTSNCRYDSRNQQPYITDTRKKGIQKQQRRLTLSPSSGMVQSVRKHEQGKVSGSKMKSQSFDDLSFSNLNLESESMFIDEKKEEKVFVAPSNTRPESLSPSRIAACKGMFHSFKTTNLDDSNESIMSKFTHSFEFLNFNLQSECVKTSGER